MINYKDAYNILSHNVHRKLSLLSINNDLFMALKTFALSRAIIDKKFLIIYEEAIRLNDVKFVNI